MLPCLFTDAWDWIVNGKIITFNHESYQHFNSLQEIEKSKIIYNQKKLYNLLVKYGCKGVITSGFRSPEYNKKIGGAINSNHLVGMAYDFRLANFFLVRNKEIRVLKSQNCYHVELRHE